jgi:hypothetical protein
MPSAAPSVGPAAPAVQAGAPALLQQGLAFTANQGQADPQVQFVSHGPGY